MYFFNKNQLQQINGKMGYLDIIERSWLIDYNERMKEIALKIVSEHLRKLKSYRSKTSILTN